jgi:UDP-galactopyranose mutase
MALQFARHLRAPVVVYDCMDELSAFLGAPPELCSLEAELLERADLVFTGGYALYRAKRRKHHSVHAFPSSVEAEHFMRARQALPEPADQALINGPRLGFFGVIDERIDLDLIATLAEANQTWQFILLGPVAKIDARTLPRRANLHWLGQKTYAELPNYLAGWDAALMPFALNAATKFISPTKTLEYLAAGRPVISTPIADVIEPYQRLGLVRIADRQGFAEAIAGVLKEDHSTLCTRVDAFLAQTSWDKTWTSMRELMNQVVAAKAPLQEQQGSVEEHV